MIICHCKRVTSEQIAEASRDTHMADGSVDLVALAAVCRATQGCGACIDSVREVAVRSASRRPVLAV
ncbi:MAG: (2Fe-2S)-binding protein [Acidimicrobiales bacterium]